MLYESYQAQQDLSVLTTSTAAFAARALSGFPRFIADQLPVRWTSAACEMVGRAHLTHARPAFGIDHTTVGHDRLEVREEVAAATPFAELLHFAKDGLVAAQPRVLVVAALAGHFSTLLRPTVRALLPDFDVFVTDWHNARDVSLADGPFGFDQYVDHLVQFLGVIGSGAHVLAVCQPCPAALAATAVMAEGGDDAVPKSLTLMAGPVDTRINPTAVNSLATEHPLSWFEQNVIGTVPVRYRGAGRRVYPGFLQVGAFMAMNLRRHVDRHVELFWDLAAGDFDKADPIKSFYDEYLAVLDLPAEFYLQTVDRVFQRHLLPRRELEWHGRRVDTGAITKTALLTVEGERDDICGVGQTMAAQDLCGNVPASKRRQYLQPGVGHYGVFSGRVWEQQVRPVVRSFVTAND